MISNYYSTSAHIFFIQLKEVQNKMINITTNSGNVPNFQKVKKIQLIGIYI